MTLAEKKTSALNEYKDAKAVYLANPTKENWINFCNKKNNCMHLGVRI